MTTDFRVQEPEQEKIKNLLGNVHCIFTTMHLAQRKNTMHEARGA